ncbi:H-NS family nucleoid-associated regulatory protein [Pantoea sp. BAV 3049]|uniref:H-NS histone family protein n=1 Tax=Pantoea sp. BAV 3049 TaxID=2654188 RepID=UPI00131DC014|nr:H-NS histone family protein [Pantoea sp. BAV 3049]
MTEEYDVIRRVLGNIRSARVFARDCDFELLTDIHDKLGVVIEERRADAEREAEERRARDIKRQELLELINTEGFSIQELLGDAPAGATKKKSGGTVAPKYQYVENGVQQTWSGRGRKPKPIQEALDAGRKLEEFLIPGVKS